jgi:hypothetical protein
MLGIRLADDMYYPSADAFRWTIPRLSRSVIADKMAAQLRAAGIEVKINEESSPIGRFARCAACYFTVRSRDMPRILWPWTGQYTL